MFYVVLDFDTESVRSPAVCWVRASQLAATAGRLKGAARIVVAESWSEQRFREIEHWHTGSRPNRMLTGDAKVFAGAN